MTLKLCLVVASLFGASAWSADFDVVVYGAPPGGIASAISAARMGRSVALIEPLQHAGGMTASGLSRSDVQTRGAIGGLYNEFVARVYKHYVGAYGAGSENVKLSDSGYSCEPHVCEQQLMAMIAAEPRIKLFLGHRLEDVSRAGRRVVSIRVRRLATGQIEEFHGRIFIDASYEGDLAAAAGAAYRTGRESRSEFNELHAGVIYVNPRTHAVLAGTTGQGDKRIQGYTYRLCLSVDPANGYVMKEPPPEYRREVYLGYLEDWKAGRLHDSNPNRIGAGTVIRAFTLTAIPNQKYDANSYAMALTYPFAEESEQYPDGSPEVRQRIVERIRNLTLGLLWFMQHDPDVPEEHRKIAQRLNLARDEFPDTNHFPWQLYVREARRIIGLYTLTENDVMPLVVEGRPPIHADAIAAGEFPIDSMPMRKRQPGDSIILEGYLGMMRDITRPYQIPYRIIVPRDVEGLLVPVAASTTHLAFSSIRLEPTWMALGHAAGLAAHMSIESGTPVSKVDVGALQRTLLKQGQVLTYFKDLEPSDPSFQAMQYFGTKGFFADYNARPGEPLSQAQAKEWLEKVGPELRRSGEQILQRKKVRAMTRGEFCRALYEADAH